MAHVLRPARGYVLLEPLPVSLVENGIHIPPCADEELKREYVVRAVGKGRVMKTKKRGKYLLLFPEVRVGDHCIANRYAGHPVDINGAPHRLVQHSSIIALVRLADSDNRLAPLPIESRLGLS